MGAFRLPGEVAGLSEARDELDLALELAAVEAGEGAPALARGFVEAAVVVLAVVTPVEADLADVQGFV
jgi:hypothetical protein